MIPPFGRSEFVSKSPSRFCIPFFTFNFYQEKFINTPAKKESKPNSAFAKPVTPSKELAEVVGSEPVPRTEITKKVWDYIKQHNLQDPANRRMINADSKLEVVFGGKKQVSMFEMTKLISAHLK